MISVLGYELSRAEEILRAEGFSVFSEEVRSRKGICGNEARVVRERLIGDREILLTYAVFKTDYEYVGG